MEWESPWGVGFPGWHIECSAMSVKYLGSLFDIHCGGKDHIPVHHTNEIAQTEACYRTRLANYWLHGYFLQTDRAKMAKSAGEFLRMQTLIERGYDPLAYRYLCLSAHYRSDLSFSWDSLDSAVTTLARLRTLVHGWPSGGSADPAFVERFTAQVNDDLNTPRALAVMWDLAKSALDERDRKATLLHFDDVLGLRLGAWSPASEVIPEEINALVAARQAARAAKDWAQADAARDELHELGYEVEDTPSGPQVRRKKSVPADT